MTPANTEPALFSGNHGDADGGAGDAGLSHFDGADVTAIRNLLRGGSVIDWHRLYFTDRQQVDRFLRINEYDPTNPEDIARLEDLREQAVEYLERYLGFRVS